MKIKKILLFLLIILPIFFLAIIAFNGCSMAQTVTNNIQKDADRFGVYRKITFVNLYNGQLLYSAEGYFSVQTSYEHEYQGQQEMALVFQIGPNEFKMDYFSIDNNVAYVIEQLENTTTDPYHWKIVWFIPTPDIEVM